MVTAIILINADRHHIGDLAQQLADLSGISEVYSVHDMVKLEGITHTESMLSFRAFSRHDLDEMFSIGM
jgi:hypothetical protein